MKLARPRLAQSHHETDSARAGGTVANAPHPARRRLLCAASLSPDPDRKRATGQTADGSFQVRLVSPAAYRRAADVFSRVLATALAAAPLHHHAREAGSHQPPANAHAPAKVAPGEGKRLHFLCRSIR